MDMSGSERIGASLEAVWQALNEPEILRQCIPGCERLEKISDTDMTATVLLKIGPIKARFEGAVQLTDLNPPNSYRIAGEGKGGVVGFAKGGADVELQSEGPGVTVLSYVVKADVGGKIAPAWGAPDRFHGQETSARIFRYLSGDSRQIAGKVGKLTTVSFRRCPLIRKRSKGAQGYIRPCPNGVGTRSARNCTRPLAMKNSYGRFDGNIGTKRIFLLA